MMDNDAIGQDSTVQGLVNAGAGIGINTTGALRLPDDSGVALASIPLPKDHWIYDTNNERPEPMALLSTAELSAEHGRDVREQLRAALRYAVRGATLCGRDMDFDPDALVINAVHALMGDQTLLRQ